MTVTIVMPMAGRGQRFIDGGYEDPKPLIKHRGKHMIEYVIDCMKIPGAKWVFLVRQDHIDEYKMDESLRELVPGCTIIPVNKVTEGAICTVLLAKDLINNENPVILKDCDQVIDWVPENFMNFVKRHDADGAVVTIYTDNPGFSFAKVNGIQVTRTAEKEVISNFGNVGIYYFGKGSDLVNYAEQMIAKNIRTNNEFYVSPVYNQFILDGKKILNYPIAEMWGLNTPEEFERNKNKLPN